MSTNTYEIAENDSTKLYIIDDTIKESFSIINQSFAVDTLLKLDYNDMNDHRVILLDFDNNQIDDFVLLTIDEELFHIDIFLFSLESDYKIKQHFMSYNKGICESAFSNTEKFWGLLKIIKESTRQKFQIKIKSGFDCLCEEIASNIEQVIEYDITCDEFEE